ncbi:DUF2637 domain-containing protein, partial [Nonomuraea sp. RK-328]|nr:DUF2637 domain-containing protein [Nonomuraea sp. RK-328]
MHELAVRHGEDEWAAALIPLSVDGTIVAASMNLLLASRRGASGGFLPWTCLVISSLASLAANVAVAEPSMAGRLIAAWPSVALIGAYEMLMQQIRRSTENEHDVKAVPIDDAVNNGDDGTPRPAGRGGRHLQRLAWQWAKTRRAEDGAMPSGVAIAKQFGRSHRWGRLVKRAGLAGEL